MMTTVYGLPRNNIFNEKHCSIPDRQSNLETRNKYFNILQIHTSMKLSIYQKQQPTLELSKQTITSKVDAVKWHYNIILIVDILASVTCKFQVELSET